MIPDLTVVFMTEQINRGRLDSTAARGWMAEQAAAARVGATGPAEVAATVGAALVRLGERIQGTARRAGTLADPAALPVR